MYKEIDTYELIDLLHQKSIHLIDIRDNYKFSQGSIANAKNIPTNFLLTNPSEYLNKEEEYYIFCNYGTTSRRVCEILSRLGYHVINIGGGYANYVEDSK